MSRHEVHSSTISTHTLQNAGW